MPKYRVTVRRVVHTEIEVDASSTGEAEDKIKSYGAVEAVSDFPVLSEDNFAYVYNAKRIWKK